VQAVKALQKKAGIALDGIYRPATEKALVAIEAKKKKPSSNGKKSSYPLPSGIYKVKSPLMRGTAVRQIQDALATLYFYPDIGAKNNGIDGYTGRNGERGQTVPADVRAVCGWYLWAENESKTNLNHYCSEDKVLYLENLLILIFYQIENLKFVKFSKGNFPYSWFIC